MGVVFLGCMGLFALSEWGEAEKRTWRWGYLDVDGEVAIPLKYEAARAFHNGRAAVQIDGLWGFIDPTGKLVVPARFRKLCSYGGADLSCAQGTEGPDWGYIDDSGAWALAPQWDQARDMVDGVAAIGMSVGFSSSRISGSVNQAIIHYGLISRDGSELVAVRPKKDPEAWTTVSPWSEGRMAVQVGKKFGYVDSTGQFVLPPKYRAAKPFLGGFAGVSGGGGWAVIDRDGTLIIEETAYLTDGASDGLIAGPGGYYDLEGKPVGPKYEWVRPHTEGLGAVYLEKQWGFVDTEPKEVIPLRYRRVSPFADGRAMAAVSEGLGFTWGIIDRAGDWVSEPVWAGVDEKGYSEGLVVVGQKPEPPAAQ